MLGVKNKFFEKTDRPKYSDLPFSTPPHPTGCDGTGSPELNLSNGRGKGKKYLKLLINMSQVSNMIIHMQKIIQSVSKNKEPILKNKQLILKSMQAIKKIRKMLLKKHWNSKKDTMKNCGNPKTQKIIKLNSSV